jgi:hypothetical protein
VLISCPRNISFVDLRMFNNKTNKMSEALARLEILIDLTSTLEHHTFLNKELQTIKNLLQDEN